MAHVILMRKKLRDSELLQNLFGIFYCFFNFGTIPIILFFRISPLTSQISETAQHWVTKLNSYIDPYPTTCSARFGFDQDMFGSSTTLDRCTTYPKFSPVGAWTHDLQIMTVHFMSLSGSRAKSGFSDSPQYLHNLLSDLTWSHCTQQPTDNPDTVRPKYQAVRHWKHHTSVICQLAVILFGKSLQMYCWLLQINCKLVGERSANGC